MLEMIFAPLMMPRAPALIHFGLVITFWINLIWPLFNILPIFPLDGGQITHLFLDRRNAYTATPRLFQVSIVTAIIGALLCLMLNMFFGIIILGMLAVQNYTMLQQYRQSGGGFRL